jgi:hypothetical protein
MRNYWSCTKFADWVRGTPKGGAKTIEDWDQWRNEAERYNPVRYWIAEELLDNIQGIFLYIPERLNDVRYYINNRWVSKAHALTAHPRDIRPGHWSDLGNRFLPCLFNELVNFVEVEQAWHYVMWNDEERKKFKTPWWRSGWLRWRTWRCPEAGLDYLRWASDLVMNEDMGLEPTDELYGKPTNQALAAREIIELYTWWTTTYRNRPDPYDASGWTAYCEASRAANGGKLSWNSSKDSAELRKMGDKAHKLLRKIEADYEAEDEAMMIRLIKVRQSLWT